MNPVTSLVCFSVRQVLGVEIENVAATVTHYFTDHSQTLPKALAVANDKSWKALGIALAGDGLFDKVKVWLTASGDEKGFREQVGRFLAGKGIAFEGSSAEFRSACLEELNKALKDKRLSADNLSATEIARQTADFRPYADPPALIKGAEEAVAQIAKALQPQYPQLAKLLAQPTPGGSPLLVAAFTYFLRKEVEKDDELANGLMFDNLKRLSATQAAAFKDVSEALNNMGERFDQAFNEMAQELERIREAAEAARKAAEAARIAAQAGEEAAKQTQGAVLDLAAEQQRLGGLQLGRVDEVLSLVKDVQRQLETANMQRGEVKPRYSFSIRSDDERKAVNALLARFRQLPEEQRNQLPALLNGLGKLQVGVGEFDGAREAFNQVAAEVNDSAAKAEAFYNAYLAALEKEQWDKALESIKQAAALDRQRFTPFPMEQYVPVRILGAGGFGTVFLCRHAFFLNKEVVVKALHAADLERGLKEVFAEAHALSELNHPTIIGVQDCNYADLGKLARPYIVMPYFAGGSLEQFVRQRGTISPEHLVAIARQIAGGMKEAHARGILHRDLKPDNVLVRKEGDQWHVKIIDFGLAMRPEAIEAGMVGGSTAKSRLTESIAGTVDYAPPEQMGRLFGMKVGRYSDVYSFGKTCFYAWFKITQPGNKLKRTISSKWQPLLEMLEECVEPNPQDRLPNFDIVLAQLNKIIEGIGAETKTHDEGIATHTTKTGPSEGMTISIQISCPQCNKELRIPADFPQGKKGRCPGCKSEFIPIPITGTIGVSKKEEKIAPSDVSSTKEVTQPPKDPETLTEHPDPKSANRSQTGHITVPGHWFLDIDGNEGLANEEAEDEEPEEEVSLFRTPGEITLESGQKYRFEVAEDVQDNALSGLSALNSFSKLPRLDLSNCKQITDAGLAYLREMTGLQKLDLFGCENITDAGLAHLRELTGLQELDLGLCNQITGTGLAYLRGLTALKKLNLAGISITENGLAHLGALSTLQVLKLYCCKDAITDAGLAHLHGLIGLQELDLSGCDQITDAGLAHLRGLSNLRTLELGQCENITDAGLAHLRGLTSLRELDLRNCIRITDGGLVHLRGLIELRELFFAHCSGILDAGLAHLRKLTNLQTLDLFQCRGITDAGLANLLGLTDLQFLGLSKNPQITDIGLAYLRGLTDLRGLYLVGCSQITDIGLAHLGALTNLTTLGLNKCKKITDAGLAYLRGLTGLQELFLSANPQFTDAGLVHLREFINLRKLYLYNCKQITDAGLNDLRSALPTCEIKPAYRRKSKDSPSKIMPVIKTGTAAMFFCCGKDCNATGDLVEDGFMVRKGSLARIGIVRSGEATVEPIRRLLIKNGVLQEKDGRLIFTQDYLFSSPSAAAMAVMGRTANGKIEWKDKDGKTLRDIQQANTGEQ